MMTEFSVFPREYILQDLSLSEGSIVFPEKGISGRIRVPIRVLEGTWWKR